MATWLVESDSILYDRMRVQLRLFRFFLVVAFLATGSHEASAQARRRSFITGPSPTPRRAAQPMRKPSDLIHKQDPIRINQSLLAQVTPDDDARLRLDPETARLLDERRRSRDRQLRSAPESAVTLRRRENLPFWKKTRTIIPVSTAIFAIHMDASFALASVRGLMPHRAARISSAQP